MVFVGDELNFSLCCRVDDLGVVRQVLDVMHWMGINHAIDRVLLGEHQHLLMERVYHVSRL